MAKWNIEQMAEVYYYTEVEADTFEEAIALTQLPTFNYWKRGDFNYTDRFFGTNLDTGEDYSQF